MKSSNWFWKLSQFVNFSLTPVLTSPLPHSLYMRCPTSSPGWTKQKRKLSNFMIDLFTRFLWIKSVSIFVSFHREIKVVFGEFWSLKNQNTSRKCRLWRTSNADANSLNCHILTCSTTFICRVRHKTKCMSQYQATNW